MKQILHKSNPWAGAFCGRPECFPCKSGDEKGDCFKRNIVYETFCLDCKKEGKDMVYVGESSRTSFERGKEHQEDYRKMTEDSHMCKHAENEHHGQEKPSFAMKVVKTHFGAFARQVHEAVRIRRKEAIILNSKGEYSRCQLPRLTVLMGEKVQDTEEKAQNNNDATSPDFSQKTAKRKSSSEEQPKKKRRKIKYCGDYREEDTWGECVHK